MNALEYKRVLLEYLINDKIEYELIAFEVPFLNNIRQADAIAIAGNQLLAFEIKADNDKIDNAPDQINDYNKVFDRTYLVTNAKNKDRCINFPCCIITYDGHKLKITQKHNKNKTEKKAIFSSMRQKHQKQMLKDYKTTNISRISLKKVKAKLIEDLKQRITPRFESYKSERSDHASLEDVAILSKHGRIG